MTHAAFVTGCQGLTLSADERALFRDAQPCGLILFDRNCSDCAQINSLIQSFFDCVGSEHLLVMIDQEGGRVQRIKPPILRTLPAAEAYGHYYDQSPDEAVEAARLVAQLTAVELARLGFNMNCVPVLDLPVPGSHEIISNRAYGNTHGKVTALAKAVAQGHVAGGVCPVIKHIPGHGRASVDSHKAVPVVDASLADLRATDFVPFRHMNNWPAAMSAHVIYDCLDSARPATTSPIIIDSVIRGEIGFGGLLISDDLSMSALSGDLGQRAAAALSAGCDVALHCNGRMEEIVAVAEVSPPLQGAAELRFQQALLAASNPIELDRDRALAALQSVGQA